MPIHLRRPVAALAVAVLTALGSLALSLSWAVQPAAAHASLVSSNPADGTAVDRAPRSVALEFSEEVREPAFVTVTAADGTEVSTGAAGVDGAEVTRDLATGDATGTMTIAYRVVSADGHPIEGELSFDVRRAAAPAPSDAASSGAAPSDAAPSQAASETATEPAARTTDDGGSSTWVVIGIGLGVAVAVAVLLGVARRRGAS